MPMVPAASIPDVVVPSVAPTPAPPNDYQTGEGFTPNAFGAQVGAALSKMGENVEKFSDVFSNYALKRQELQNETDARTANNNAIISAGNIEAKLHSMTGQDAADYYQNGYITDLQAVRDQARGSLKSGMAQKMFDDQFGNFFARTIQTGAIYSAGQRKEARINSNLGTVTGAMQQVGSNLGDDDYFNTLTTSARDASMAAVADKLGLPSTDPAVVAAGNKTVSHIWATRLEQIAVTDAGSAMKMFNANQDAIVDPEVRVTLLDKLHSLAKTQVAQQIASGSLPGATGPVQPFTGAADPELINYGKQAAAKYGVPWEVFSHQIAGESGWNPNVATSSAGAQGIAQFVPSTAAQYKVNVHDPKASLDAAAHYMSDLHAQSGTWQAALTGYLSGKPRDTELTAVTSQNPGYANAYKAARAADKGGPTSLLPPAWEPAPAKEAHIDFAIGDSIANGTGTAADLDKSLFGTSTDANRNNTALHAVDGRSPAQVLSTINSLKSANPTMFQGKTVFLSTGASNFHDPANELASINSLKDAGANVIVSGVGAGVKNADLVNNDLKAMADKAGVPFTGELAGTRGSVRGGRLDVHPDDYHKTLAQIGSATPTQPQAPDTLQARLDKADASYKDAVSQGIFDSSDSTILPKIRADVISNWNVSTKALADQRRNYYNDGFSRVMTGNNGQPYLSMDDFLSNPTNKTVYSNLDAKDQESLAKVIVNNSKNPPMTPEMQARILQLHGQADLEPDEFMKIKIPDEDIPYNDKKTLIAKQDQISKLVARPVDVQKAVNLLKNTGILDGTSVDPAVPANKPQLHIFAGALGERLQEFKNEKKRDPTTDELKDEASKLLRVQVPGTWLHGTFGIGSPEQQGYQVYVPNQFRKDFVSRFRESSGAPPDNATVVKAYQTHLQNLKGGTELEPGPAPTAEPY